MFTRNQRGLKVLVDQENEAWKFRISRFKEANVFLFPRNLMLVN